MQAELWSVTPGPLHTRQTRVSSITPVKPCAVRHSVTTVRSGTIPPHLTAELPTGQLKAQKCGTLPDIQIGTSPVAALTQRLMVDQAT